MHNKRKLYYLTERNFELPLYVDAGLNVKTMPANNIPSLVWPNGRWCLPANFFMLRLYENGLSRKDRGGTLLTYATHISHLIRFCDANKIDFTDLTDNYFSFFISALMAERRPSSPEKKARDSNSIINIGRTCLHFLSFVGDMYCIDNFLGTNGQIRAELKESTIRDSRDNVKKIIKRYWHHRSFPTADPLKKRLPISNLNIEKLSEAVLPSSGSIHQRTRRYAMLKLLEITGGRRYEVANTKVKDIYAASNMLEPMLKIPTGKRAGGTDGSREIPIGRHDITYFIQFIEKNRKRAIRETCGAAEDEGCLLISETSGKGLKSNTITSEISILAKHAGISEQTCPHMFRHRFITKIFIALLEQFKFENEDDFRRALIDTQKLKQKVMEWTGHTNVQSLEPYIHFAFDEYSGLNKSISLVTTRSMLTSFKRTLQQFKDETQNGLSPLETANRLYSIVNSFEQDIDRLGAS